MATATYSTNMLSQQVLNSRASNGGIPPFGFMKYEFDDSNKLQKLEISQTGDFDKDSINLLGSSGGGGECNLIDYPSIIDTLTEGFNHLDVTDPALVAELTQFVHSLPTAEQIRNGSCTQLKKGYGYQMSEIVDGKEAFMCMMMSIDIDPETNDPIEAWMAQIIQLFDTPMILEKAYVTPYQNCKAQVLDYPSSWKLLAPSIEDATYFRVIPDAEVDQIVKFVEAAPSLYQYNLGTKVNLPNGMFWNEGDNDSNARVYIIEYSRNIGTNAGGSIPGCYYGTITKHDGNWRINKKAFGLSLT